MKAILKSRISYTMKENDTLKSVCNMFNANISSIKLYNMIQDVEEGDTIFFPEDKKNVYVVKPADTFYGISKKLNIKEEDLLKITGSYRLFIGQRIEF